MVVTLEGTLDHLNAQELLKRIKEAADKARLDIIINFEHPRHATPEALTALLDGGVLREAMPCAKVRYQKFRAAFEQALQGLSLAGSDFLSEDIQDA